MLANSKLLGLQRGAVAVVEDDPTVRKLTCTWLEQAGYRVVAYDSVADFSRARLEGLAVVCLDVDLGDGSGLDLLASLNDQEPDLPVIMLTAAGDAETAVRAMRAGAYDYIVKPAVQEVVMHSVHRAMERRCLTQLLAQARGASRRPEGLTGNSPQVQDILQSVDRLRDSEAAVSISGPRGSGKEQLARMIHKKSRRAGGAFVVLRATDLPPERHQEELFGGPAGEGRVRQAQAGGTLFLGDVDGLAWEAQLSLLEHLRDWQHSDPSVGERPRLICSSRFSLQTLVDEGRMPERLRPLLDVYPIHLPPLAERREDIPALVGVMLSRFSAERADPVRRVSSEAMELMMRSDWPGNVRELETVVHRAVLSARGDEIRPSDLPEGLREIPAQDAEVADVIPLRVLEGREIKKAMRATDGSVDKAAKLLGIGRATLYRRLARMPEAKTGGVNAPFGG